MSAHAGPSAPGAGRTRRATWTLRLARAALVLVAGRLLLAALVPFTVERAAHALGFDLAWERLRVHYLRGDLTVDGLSVRIRPGEGAPPDAPFLRAESLRADVAVLGLLRGELRAQRVEADGVDLVLERRADGSAPLVDALARALASEEPETPVPPEPPAPLDLASPVQVDRLRVRSARVHLRDEVACPGQPWVVYADVEADALGYSDRQGRLVLRADAPGMLEGLRALVALETRPDDVHVAAALHASGIRPAALVPWLPGLEADPAAGSLGLDGALDVALAVTGERRDALAGTLTLSDLLATVDGAEAGRLQRATLDVAALSADGLHVALAAATRGRVGVRRTAEGDLCALGFALSRSARPADAEAPRIELDAPFSFELDAVHLDELALWFTDEAFDPPVRLGALLASAEVSGIDLAGRAAEPARIAVRAGLPGVAAGATLRGTAALFRPARSVALDVAVEGLRPDALAPYLGEIGLASTLQDGRLTARLVGAGEGHADGRVTGDLRLEDVRLTDGVELFRVGAVELSGVEVDPAVPSAKARELAVRGTTLPLARERDGALAALGLRTTEPRSLRRPARAAAAAAPKPPESFAAGIARIAGDLPRVELGRVAVVENRLSWRDGTLEPAVDVVFDDCGVEVEGLALGGDPARFGPATAHVRIWSRAQDLVRELDVEGSVTTRPGPLDLKLDLAASAGGITARRMQPYIDPTGIEERLQAAALSGRLALAVQGIEDGLRLDLELRDATMRNAESVVLGARLLRVQDARLARGAVQVAAVELDGGEVHVARDPLGALLALGFRIPLSVFRAAEAAAGEAPDGQAEAQVSGLLAGLPNVSVGTVRARATTLAWADHAFEPPIEAEARLDAEVDGLATRAGPAPARFDVRLAVEGSARAVRVAGTLALDPHAAEIDSTWEASGVRAGRLAPYLPQGLTCDLEDGELRSDLRVSVRDAAQGGVQAALHVGRVRVAERGDATPLLALERADVAVERADPAAGVYDVGALEVAGVEVGVRRSADGALHAVGFGLAPRAAPGGGGAGGADAPVPEPAPDAGAPDAGAAPRGIDLTPRGVERLRIARLQLELARLSFHDELRGAQPVTASLRVSAPDGLRLVDADPRSLPPLALALDGTVAPFVGAWHADVELAPWVEEPELRAAFRAQGISATDLAAIDPTLPAWVDGSGLSEGVASGEVEARLRWRRRSPLDLDLRSGFAADVEVGRLELRDAPGGALLAGLDGAEAEVARVDPARGVVHVKTLELRTPILRASRAEDGVHVLGLVIHPELRPAAAAAPEAAAAGAPVEAAATADGEPGSGAAELRIDELLVRGIDVELRDDAADPPSVVPLDDLDVQVRRFTTRALTEPRAIRFDAWLGAGDAELPRSVRADSLLEGIGSALGDALSGEETQGGTERRPLFHEAALTGSVQLYPALTGHAQLTLAGLELLGLRGTAAHEGLTIGDGTLDASARLRFRGEEGVRVDSELVFSDLSLSEPKDGPVETWLTLPVPLDTVLFLLEDANGEHHVPVSFTLDEEGLTASRIAGAAAGAAASVLTSAIAAAPVRVLTTFTDLFGLTGGAEEPPPSAELVFAPGSIELAGGSWSDPAATAGLAALVARLRADDRFLVRVQHRLGRADVARADELANPSAEDCLAIAAGLRHRRAELVRARAELAAEVRAAWGVGGPAEAHAGTQRLRALESEIARVEDALDHVFDLVRPGAERHRPQRTRAAALAVARARIERVRAWFAAQNLDGFEARFEARTPGVDVAPEGQPGGVLVVLSKRE